MNMARRSLPCVLALSMAAMTAPLALWGQPITAGGPVTFSDFDQNGDGSISESELAAVRAERQSQRAQQGMPMRGAATAPSFSDFDQDGDGQISPDEFNSLQQQRMQQRPGMGSGMGPGMGPGMGRGMGMPSFSTFDLDGDGILTQDEFNKAHSQRMQQRAQQGYPMRNAAYAPGFETFDRDGDGRVNASEFAAAQAEHRQRMMGQP